MKNHRKHPKTCKNDQKIHENHTYPKITKTTGSDNLQISHIAKHDQNRVFTSMHKMHTQNTHPTSHQNSQTHSKTPKNDQNLLKTVQNHEIP